MREHSWRSDRRKTAERGYGGRWQRERLPWFVIWEEAIWRLLSRKEKQARDGTILYAKFNERALLRGSMKNQSDFLASALGRGGGKPFMEANEAREALDMNPHPDGGGLSAAAPRPGTTAADIVEDQ